ncbi:unnamed protein product [Ectocarpus sp. 8 AP-2014]
MPNNSECTILGTWLVLHARTCVRTNFRYPHSTFLVSSFPKHVWLVQQTPPIPQQLSCQNSSVANEDINGHSNDSHKHLLAMPSTLDTTHPPRSARILSAEHGHTGCGRDARRQLFNTQLRWFPLVLDSRAS